MLGANTRKKYQWEKVLSGAWYFFLRKKYHIFYLKNKYPFGTFSNRYSFLYIRKKYHTILVVIGKKHIKLVIWLMKVKGGILTNALIFGAFKKNAYVRQSISRPMRIEVRQNLFTIKLFLRGDFLPIMSKSIQIWDPFFPLVFPKESESLKFWTSKFGKSGKKDV